MRITIGCDHAGLRIKNQLAIFLKEKGIHFEDFGTFTEEPVDYPDIALKVAEAIKEGRFERGILICGLGIGMEIAANKVPGIRAALCHDCFSAEKSRTSNNAQILTFGAKVISPKKAKKVVETWLSFDFKGGESARKLEKITQIEKKYSRH